MPQVCELWDRQVRMPPGGGGLDIWIFENPEGPYLKAGFLEKAKTLFDQAERAADDAAVRKRVRKARLPIEYTELMWSKKFEAKNGWYAPVNLNALKDHWKTFVAKAR